jgi:RNA polymerase sigma-70 factor (ECF subfamily)
MNQDLQKTYLEAYEAYADAIYRHCYFRVFSKERAEELAQDTFLKTWEYLAAGKEVQNLRAFLYQVATNLIIDYTRKKKEQSLDALLEDDGFEPASDEHKKMERSAAAKEVLSIIHELEPADREVLVMRYVDDLDPKEIAHILKTSPNTISVRIHRAMEKVREKYGGEMPI